MISKQTQKAISYIFAVLVVSLGTIFLVAMAQGYKYDFLTGQIKESGLVLIDSKPNNADIYINGKRNKAATPLRLTNAPIGPMNIELIRPEYRVWKKSLVVQAQQVSFADYALLLPQKLIYNTYLPEYKITQLVQSGDQSRSFMTTSKPEVAVWQLDNNQATKKLYAPPLNSGDVELSGLSVNNDGSRVLVTQRVGTSSSTLVITGQDVSLNLSANLQVSGGSLSFNPSNNNELYWLSTDKLLRKLNIGNQTIGSVIAQNVTSIQPDGNQVYAVIAPNADSTVSTLWRLEGDGSKRTKLNVTIPESSSYVLKLEKIRSGSYLALLGQSTKELLVIRNLDQTKPLTGLLSKSVTAFTISNNGEHIVYNAADRLKTYDIEQAERFDFGVNLAGMQSWEWYDDNHLTIVANNQLRLIDYDGQNDQILSDRGDNVASSAIHPNNKDIVYISAGGLKTVRLTQN